MFSSIWGYAIAAAHLRGESIVKPAVTSLALAAFIHGVYDFVSTDPLLAPASALAIGVVWIWRMRLVAKLHEAQPADAVQPADDG